MDSYKFKWSLWQPQNNNRYCPKIALSSCDLIHSFCVWTMYSTIFASAACILKAGFCLVTCFFFYLRPRASWTTRDGILVVCCLHAGLVENRMATVLNWVNAGTDDWAQSNSGAVDCVPAANGISLQPFRVYSTSLRSGFSFQNWMWRQSFIECRRGSTTNKQRGANALLQQR